MLGYPIINIININIIINIIINKQNINKMKIKMYLNDI
jgi:hypothetical protein